MDSGVRANVWELMVNTLVDHLLKVLVFLALAVVIIPTFLILTTAEALFSVFQQAQAACRTTRKRKVR